MYYSQIRVDPKDRNRVYMLGSNRGFYVSDDGGKTFTRARSATSTPRITRSGSIPTTRTT